MSDTSEETPRGERGVACTYSECQHRFPSIKAMREHKTNDPVHFYCKKCDVDCEDWEGLTKHKVDMMAPFIEGRKKVRDEKPVHIVCEFCGESFKSFDGRKLHRARIHPADQDIDCPGCHKKFIRATHMIDHLERGECKDIPRWMLHASINHKYIVSQVMEAPEVFQAALTHFQQPASNPDLREVTDSSESFDKDYGGVSIMDNEDDAQMGGYRALEPEVNLIDGSPQSSQSTQEAWPLLRTPVKNISHGMRNMSISSTATSRRGGLKVVTAPASVDDNNPKSPPAAGDWNAISKDHAKNRVIQNGNILSAHFWNPDDPDYLVDQFLDPVLQAHRCPFPVCRHDTKSYKTQQEMQQHICDMHYITMFACPWCFRRFDKVAALMGHVEYSQKCRVKESSKFEKFIAQITGGFLTAQSVSQPKIFRFDTSLIKAGDSITKVGVQKTKFSGALPR